MLFALLVTLAWQALAGAPWPRLFAAAAGASLAIALFACFASYGIWEEWWLGTLWFSLFLTIVMARVADPALMPAANAQPPPLAARLG